jgi:hypothetical protein
MSESPVSSGRTAIPSVDVRSEKSEDLPQILIEFAPTPGLREVSLTPADVVKRSSEALSEAMSVIRGTSQRVASTLASLPSPPSEATVTFGVKLDASAGALIARTGIEAQLVVALTWRYSEPPASHS